MNGESFEFRCANCGRILLSGSPEPGWISPGPCPGCGSIDVVGYVMLQERLGRSEDAVSYVGRDALTNEQTLKGHARHEETKTGRLAGTKAWVEQMRDKSVRAGRYKKKVTLSDGTVVKNVDGPLSDQSLHGPQQPMS